jgi:cytochrome c oxidase subunit II
VTSKQLLITISYSIASLLAIGALAAVFLSTRRHEQPASLPEHGKMARLENYWGYFVTALLIVFLVLTIIDIPYGKGAPGGPSQRVTVIGQQFAWNIEPSTIRAHVPVRFSFTSNDVQHGFGIYDGEKLLFQVQVPAKGESAQVTYFTFPHPGTYTINCLEFCGFHHYLMVGTMKVT